MTGNTKVWRAPLAGLASVAMLATMGLVAGTANAASVQYDHDSVTLNANGGQFMPALNNADGSANFGDGESTAKYVDSTRKQVAVTDKAHTDSTGYEYTDGVYPGLYAKYGTDANIRRNGYVFTGWYTSPDAGGQAVDPASKIEDGTTLYAHWAYGPTDESETVVKFDFTNKTSESNLLDWSDPDGASNVVKAPGDTYNGRTSLVYVRLADGDEIADWQTPSVDHPGDGWLFKGWDKDVASAVRGTTLTAQADPGLTVNLTSATGVKLFKDGALISGNKFDVARNGSAFDGVQAVRGEGDPSVQLAYNWAWSAGDGTITGTTNHGEALTVPEGVGSINATAQGWQDATEYRIRLAQQSVVSKYYFTLANSSFVDAYGQETLDELSPRVNNDAFLGWYDLNGKFEASGTKNVKDFFTNGLVAQHWDTIKPIVPPTFNFANQYGQGVADIFAGYQASAAYTNVIVHPLYDQAKGFTVKFYTGRTIGEQLKDLEASGQLDRDGYSVADYYRAFNASAQKPTGLLTAADKAKLFYGDFSDLYVTYSADSKTGPQGLLQNLLFGYEFLKKDSAGNVLASKDAEIKVTVSTTGVVTSSWNKTGSWSGSTVELVRPEGYTDASWKDFNATRRNVVTELQKEFSLKSHGTSDANQAADILEVYGLVSAKLSAEKADTYNQEFGGQLVAKTDYPDVNYDDYGTHHKEITELTSKGIVKGYADGTFGYGAPVARVDFLVWIYRAAGKPAVSSAASFSDVTAVTVPNQEFRDAIAWAASKGITKGYADGTFAPYAPIARQDAAAFLYRAAGSPKFNESYAGVKFQDVTPGDTANHSQAVLWAADNGIAKGYAGTVSKFAGHDIVVRQDAAAFLARALNFIK